MAKISVDKTWDLLRYQLLRKVFLKRAGSALVGYGLMAVFIALTVYACSFSSVADAPDAGAIATKFALKPLVILWDKGYVTEEDEAIKQVVADWEAQAGLTVDLSFYNSGETAPRTLRASQAGLPPDILFAAKSVYPVSDWEGKLADVTEVVAPLASSYTPEALQAAKVYGSEKAKDRYYAVPLSQNTTHIYYWKDLLQEAGYKPTDIPSGWDEFWSFWETVQSRLRATHPNIHSIGMPYSAATAFDTYHIFEQVLVAYEADLLDDSGDLRLDEPDVKAAIIQSLNWYLQFYEEGYVPTNAVNWLDPDNNRSFLNREVVMTPNPTLSIPAAVRNDEDIYFNKLGTVEFPNKPNGELLPHLVDIRKAIIFADASSQQVAKDFLAYLTQPQVLSKFLKTSYGRYMPPAISQIKADSYWQDPADPHVSTVVKTALKGQTKPFYNVLNPAYGVVMENNVWGQAVHTMAVDGLSAEDAAAEAIASIKTIFREAS